MSRLLDPAEIQTLVALVRQTYSFLRELRASNQLAEEIHFPKTPATLSQSIAAHLLRTGLIFDGLTSSPHVEASSSGGDLTVTLPSGRVLSTEVKGSAVQAYQQLGKRDVEADLLLWIHFGDCFSNPDKNELVVLTLVRPGRLFKTGQIGLDKFVRVAGAELAMRRVSILTLTEISEDQKANDRG